MEKVTFANVNASQFDSHPIEAVKLFLGRLGATRELCLSKTSLTDISVDNLINLLKFHSVLSSGFDSSCLHRLSNLRNSLSHTSNFLIPDKHLKHLPLVEHVLSEMSTFLNEFPEPPVALPDLAQHQAERKRLQHLVTQHQAELKAILSQEFTVLSHNQLQLRDKTLLHDYKSNIRDLRRALSLPSVGSISNLADQVIDKKARTRAWSRLNDLHHQNTIKVLKGKQLNPEACEEFAALKVQYPNWTPPRSEKSASGAYKKVMNRPTSYSCLLTLLRLSFCPYPLF